MRDISIEKLKSSSVLCNEGYPYECTVLVDGQRFCKARDDASGGPLIFEPLPKVDYQKTWGSKFLEIVREIDSDLKKNHPKYDPGQGLRPMEVDLEFKVALLAEDEFTWKDIQKLTKRKIIFMDPEDGLLKEIGLRRGFSMTDALIANYQALHPKYIIINGLSKKEALELWRRKRA